MSNRKPKGKDRIYTLEGFRDWLKQQPKRGRYDYLLSNRCAVAQYLEAQGEPVQGPKRESFEFGRNPIADTIRHVAADGAWTFGAAGRRADKLLGR